MSNAHFLADEYWDGLPTEALDAASKIGLDGLRFVSATGTRYEDVVEAFAIASEFVLTYDFIPISIPQLSSELDQNRILITDFFTRLRYWASKEIVGRTTKASLERGRSRFAMRTGVLFAYRFAEDEVAEIQEAINELQEIISGSADLTDEHKGRILTRLEQLQAELHKKISDLDRFWGLVGDAGIVVRKFAENTKDATKVVALIYKISMLVWNAQLDAHDLPRSEEHPLLPARPLELPPVPEATLPPSNRKGSQISASSS